VTIILLGKVYLPMLYRHQKIKEFHNKEMLARSIITEKEEKLISQIVDHYIAENITKDESKKD
jgi:hypothetical protein